jgi:biopolymer transport protein ExbD
MAFGGGLDDTDDMVSEINMTPLVDVMLVLLIIFIITVPVLTHAVKLDLPRVQNEPNIVKPQTITLAVTRDGMVHWDDMLMNQEDLQRRLREAALQQPQPEVHIRGDREVDYEYVMKVMAAVQRAGILKLGFITEPGI